MNVYQEYFKKLFWINFFFFGLSNVKNKFEFHGNLKKYENKIQSDECRSKKKSYLIFLLRFVAQILQTEVFVLETKNWPNNFDVRRIIKIFYFPNQSGRIFCNSLGTLSTPELFYEAVLSWNILIYLRWTLFRWVPP